MRLFQLVVCLSLTPVCLLACADHSATPPADGVSSSTETVEVLGTGSFRHGGLVLTADELGQALARADDTSSVNREPLRFVAEGHTTMEEVVPALEVAVERSSSRVNLVLEVHGGPEGRWSTLPILVSHGCGALSYSDGTYAYDDHGESPSYVYVQVIFESGGTLAIGNTGYRAEEPSAPVLELSAAPRGIAAGAPKLGTRVNFDALGEWFDSLEEQGVRPFVCLDWQPTTTVGQVVDALRAARSAVGPRVLQGPDPWGGPEEEEPGEEYVEEE